MYLNPALCPPFVDADRKGANAPKGAGITARWWFVIALVATFAGWMVWRWGVR
jgi:hypothetical protein